MTTTTKKVSVAFFQIHGDFITNTSRDFLEEGSWRKAYNFLMENLHGMESQIAIDILKGKKKLTGVNDLRLEDDNMEAEINGWLSYQYANCFAYRDRIYRPYGYVVTLTGEDMRLATKIGHQEDAEMLENKHWDCAEAELSDQTKESFLSNRGEFQRYRPAYFAKNRRSDICVTVKLPKVLRRPVLCEQLVVDVPLWYRITTDAQATIKAAFESGELTDLSKDARDSVDRGAVNSLFSGRGIPPPRRQSREEIDAEIAKGELEAKQHEEYIKTLQAQIAAQTDADVEYGWKDYSEKDDELGIFVSIRVPYRAFICAALGRARASHLMPEYSPRCPSGLKLPMDDRYHSDAWIGAGFHPDSAYDDKLPEQRLFMTKLYDLQREKLNFDFDILARGTASHASGEVIHDPAQAGPDKILVVASAAPEYAPAAIKCKAVIVETGSKLAHMTIVSREEGVPVIRVSGAVTKFKPGRRLFIDLAEGKVELSGV